jgi:hypothetical protein
LDFGLLAKKSFPTAEFSVGKDFLRQQPRSWMMGKLWTVGEAIVSCSVSYLFIASLVSLYNR